VQGVLQWSVAEFRESVAGHTDGDNQTLAYAVDGSRQSIDDRMNECTDTLARARRQ
jgi:hypothetical protein